MSGGSFGYMYSQIEEMYSGAMGDIELEEFLKDFCNLLHDLEWANSADICTETYKKTIKEFKNKWFGGGGAREKRLEKIINEEIEKLKKSLMEMI